MTIDERMDRLIGIVEVLANTAVSHDDQIEELIKVGESQQQKLDDFKDASRRFDEIRRDDRAPVAGLLREKGY
jgi:hypothetical protein